MSVRRPWIVAIAVALVLAAAVAYRFAGNDGTEASVVKPTPSTAPAVLPLGRPVRGVLMVDGEAIDLMTGVRRKVPVRDVAGSAVPAATGVRRDRTGVDTRFVVDASGAVREVGEAAADLAWDRDGLLHVLRVIGAKGNGQSGPGPVGIADGDTPVGDPHASTISGVVRTDPFAETRVDVLAHHLGRYCASGLAVLSSEVVVGCGNDIVRGIAPDRPIARNLTIAGVVAGRVLALDERLRLVLVGLDGSVTELPGSTRPISAVAASPDGRYVAAAYRDGGDMTILDLRDVPFGMTVPDVRMNPTSDRLAWLPDSSAVLASTFDAVVSVEPRKAAATPLVGVKGGGVIATIVTM